MKKRLVINADDFGLCTSVNKAVAKAHSNGVLTSTTLMTNTPAAEEAVQIARRLPHLGVGIHLNLTIGRSLTGKDVLDGLVDAHGNFTGSLAKVVLFALAGPASRRALRTELEAQIRWALDRGLEPTHLDSHKHVHMFPPIYSITCHLARTFGIGAVRHGFEPAQVCSFPWPLPTEGGKKRARVIRNMARLNRLQNAACLKTDVLLGIAHTGRIDENFYKTVSLYNSAATTEIMTHPGLGDSSDDPRKKLPGRQAELDALCSNRTRAFLEDAQITLVHYGRLCADRV